MVRYIQCKYVNNLANTLFLLIFVRERVERETFYKATGVTLEDAARRVAQLMKEGDDTIRRFSFGCWIDNGRIPLGAPFANVPTFARLG